MSPVGLVRADGAPGNLPPSPPNPEAELDSATGSNTNSTSAEFTPTAEASSSTLTEHIPANQLVRPQWGLALMGSLNASTGTNLGTASGGTVRNLSLQLDFQPAILQGAGVFDLGPFIGVFPVQPTSSGVTNTLTGIWAFGAQVRYQARYFREQPVVPFVGYALQNTHYSLLTDAAGHPGTTGVTGNFIAQGPVFGGMLLLNVLEPSAATEMYIDSAVSRSYLVAELRDLTGNDGNVTFSGVSFYFGLRIEY